LGKLQSKASHVGTRLAELFLIKVYNDTEAVGGKNSWLFGCSGTAKYIHTLL